MAPRLPNPTIVMTPPVQSSTAAASHPRRPPAHRSVSLKHGRTGPKEVDTSSDSSASRAMTGDNGDNGDSASKGSSGSPSSLQPFARDSSGESSNAEQWFQKSNNDVHDHSASFADNDPPFFMRNSSSSETPPDAQGQRVRSFLNPNGGSNTLPLRTGLLRQGGTEGSSTEDYRSVIDDLTIENKNLKRRLKKYEKLHDSHLKDEKLFEVRIHGLAPHKKRELEETLRTFASSLSPGGLLAAGYEGVVPAVNTPKTASLQTQVSDSAYASMSGQGSALSGVDTRHKHVASTNTMNKQNIHTYLHHIPEGLLPQTEPNNMTERAKKKLVVRRLEQIFAGKGAVAGLHTHPIQQQEVSQSAARADRAASEAQGSLTRTEGCREARIMTREEKPGMNNDSSTEEAPVNIKAGKKRPQEAVASNTRASSEQRPTRPLDLDPHRAQIPVENIEYMRHLGFSPPNPGEEEAQDGHGWVYLNLLVNLAQLHTISVTSDFVRKALGEFSSKFEISKDGRKVRWKGGQSVTRTSSSGGGSSVGPNTPDRRSPRKRPKLVHRESDRSVMSSHPQSGASTRKTLDNKLAYTPLFFHKDSTDDGDVSSEEDDDGDMSPRPLPMAGDSSGMTSSGRQSTATRKTKKRADGPIIFYNNARFCTDLSGDRRTNGNPNAPPYVPATTEPVGGSHNAVQSRYAEKRGPLAEASELPEPMNLSDNPIPQALELSFPHRSLPSSNDEVHLAPVDFEVSGIGGVWPTDNFAIEVESRHALVDHAVPYVNTREHRRRLPTKLARILNDASDTRKSRGSIRRTVISTESWKLMPSELPAALCYMTYGDDSAGDNMSDMDDEMSIAPQSPGGFPPATAPQPVELLYASSEHEDDDDDSDVESDSSLDLLAAARQIDPEAIRQQEREYDAQYAERLADEIPTGSSAATAGGGSGFASPNEGMSLEEYEQVVRAAQKRKAAAAKMSRQSTADSMKAVDPREDVDGEDEDMRDTSDA